MSKPANLVTLRPGVTLASDAAASFQRVEKAAGRQVDVNSSYRDWDEQYQLWLDYRNGVPGAPLALHPDESMHCKGLAIDSDDHSLMVSMGAYGWRQTALAAGEPWHFDYFRQYDKHFGEPTSGGSRPLEPPTDQEEEEEDMTPRQIHHTETKGKITRALVVPGTGYFVKWTETGATYANNIGSGFETGDSVQLTKSLFDVFEREATALRPKDALTIGVADVT